ncbi:DsbA family oxidoreductase [Aerophototrophica crusticola]|uniref:DsbA family oxidoreductase n=1 Tax=Aerophototrophica crusticola TaxID=1709002 RepID=A0A858R6B6_9PROT|nr:DsbA family oxidoreductase [Rhodospirillaceae bacterium B3]
MLIEIYADFTCPWCHIGKRRLERALAERPRLPVEIRWLPFLLNPDLPPGGMDRQSYLAAKFGGLLRARDVHTVIEQTAARDGVPLRLDLIRRTPNTLDAHRLVRLAEEAGLADRLVSLLFRAFFEEGQDIGNHRVLATLAGRAGLNPAEAYGHVRGDRDRQRVLAADERAKRLGVHSVPAFVFNRRYALGGAQDWTALVPMLDLAAEDAALED